MPVFLTDFTNRVWAMESPLDGYLQIGFVGRPGFKVEDLLAFAETQEKQFNSFLKKKEERITKANGRNPVRRSRRSSNGTPDQPVDSGEGTQGR